MRKCLLLSAIVLISLRSFSQVSNVGIGTNDPRAKLDVQGGISLREGTAISLVAGNNDNVALPGSYSFYRIVAPTGSAFSILGIVPSSGADGQVVTLVNTTTQVMTIKNNSSGTAANSIRTLTGNDIVSVAGGSSITLQYNKTEAKWYVTGSQNFTVTSGSIATSDIEPGTNSAITVVNGTGKTIGAGDVVLDVTTNALNQKGIVSAPTGGDADEVWGTDAGGNPGWTKIGNPKLSNSSVTVNTGAGLSGGGTVALGGTLNIANTAPDQTVVLSNGSGISATGTYPNFTITNTGDVNAADDITTGSTAGGDLSGTFSNLQINSGAVGTTEIANGSIAAADLSNLGAGTGQSVYWNGTAWVPYTPTTGTVTGSGTANYVARWGSTTTLTTGAIYDNGGSVGIGTTATDARLNVVGVNSNTAGDHHLRVGNNFGWRVDASTGQNFVLEGNNSGTWTTGLVVNRLAGNVGIGTLNPPTRLSIASADADFTTGLSFGRSATGVGKYVLTNSDNQIFRIAFASNAGTAHADYATRMVIDPTGKFGIGTTAPGYYLQVGDNIAANNTDYNIAITRHGTLGTPGTYSANVPAVFIQDISGDGPITAETGGILDISTPRIADTDAGAANANHIVTRNDNGYGLVVRADRNVGIATNAPTQRLDVNGQIKMRSGAATGYIPVSSADGTMSWTNPSSITTGNDWLVNGTHIYNANSGNVGIGTGGSPEAKLDVNGSINSNGNINAQWGNVTYYMQYPDGSTVSPTYAMGFATDANNRRLYVDNKNNDGSASDPNGGIIFRTGSTLTDRMVVTYGGNVGIGINTPQALLHVGGNSARYFTVNSVGLTSIRFDDNGVPAVLNLENRGMTAVNHGASINYNLNIGSGAAVTSGQIRVSAESNYSTSANQDAYMLFGTALDGNVSERMRISSAGNVGIGATNPGSRLTVQRPTGAGSTPDIWTGDGSQWLFVNSNSSAGSWNSLVGANDASLVFSAGAVNTGALVIGPWATTASGLRIETTATTIGGGGEFRLLTTAGAHRGSLVAVEATTSGGAGGAAGFVIATSGGESICFKQGGVGGTPIMTLTGANRVGIGVTAPSYKLQLPNNSATTDGWVLAYSYNTYSDARLKTNRQPLKYGLSTVLQLQPMSYVHHNSEVENGRLVISDNGAATFGLLAQETYKVIPEMVAKPQDETTELWSIDYSKLGPVLVKAVQEQQIVIEQQSSDIEKMKKEIEALKNAINK